MGGAIPVAPPMAGGAGGGTPGHGRRHMGPMVPLESAGLIISDPARVIYRSIIRRGPVALVTFDCTCRPFQCTCNYRENHPYNNQPPPALKSVQAAPPVALVSNGKMPFGQFAVLMLRLMD